MRPDRPKLSVPRRGSNETLRARRPQLHDDVIAADRFALLRYFASGLIAGGAGVTLTLLLSAIRIHPASYVALGALQAALLGGCLYFLRSATRWMGIPVPRWLTLVFAFAFLWQILTGVVEHPAHTVLAFSSSWWGLVGRAVIATVFGAGFRFFAEMEIDDLQFGLDHGLGVVQELSGAPQAADEADEPADRLNTSRLVATGILVVILRRVLGDQ